MEQKNQIHVIFGSGPIGKAVMKELVSQGRRVRIVNRSGKLDVSQGVEVYQADATDPAAVRQACQGAGIVYNCTNPPYNRWPELFPKLQSGLLAGAAAAGAKLVVMDNLYMYGSTHGRPMTEDLPYSATTRKGTVRARMAEDLLKAHAEGKVQVAIGRASDYFGPGAVESSGGERMFVPALAGKPVQVLGNPDLPHTYTYVPDIGKALVILGDRPESLGRVWHLPSPQTVTTRQFIGMICKEIGQTPHISPTPKFVIQALGLFDPILREVAEMVYEFEEAFIMDSSDFEKTFGMKATPLPEAIQTTIGWFQERLRVGSKSFGSPS